MQYTAQVDEHYKGCPYCRSNKMWTVIDVAGITIGQSFADEEMAVDIANHMNHAYEKGVEHSTQPA